MRPAQFAGVEVFSGWKEIASYLGKGVRTVQRYERNFSLPVRRPVGKSPGSVIATKAELDGWVTAAPFRRKFRLSQASVSKNGIGIKAILNQINRQSEKLRQLHHDNAELCKRVLESVELLQKNLRLAVVESCTSERRVQPGLLGFPSKKVQ